MMEWLKALLEKAEIKDGVLDIDKLMSTVNTEAPKNVMSKQEYNSINEQLKTANKTIDDLKKNNSDNASLQAKISEHEETIKTMKTSHEKEIAKMRKESAIKDSLRKLNAKHEDLLLGKFNLDNIQINADGSFSGLEEQTKKMQEDYKDLFEETQGKDVKGLKSHDAQGKDKPDVTVSQGSNFAKELNASGKNTESKFFN